MNDTKHTSSSHGSGGLPITEADLHGYVDQQLSPARFAEVEQYLNAHPHARQRVQEWQQQNQLLRGLLNPVLDEPVPVRMLRQPRAAASPWRRRRGRG